MDARRDHTHIWNIYLLFFGSMAVIIVFYFLFSHTNVGFPRLWGGDLAKPVPSRK